MDKPYYVLLTGGKNNAGDYLIASSAKAVIESERNDRGIVELNAWESLEEHLDVVNNAVALILCGGPALRENMYPGIYPLISDLDLIKVPICSLGIGWKSLRGDYFSVGKYKFNSSSKRLIKRIEDDGIGFSVRDYYSGSILQAAGVMPFVTGCPAMYGALKLGRVDCCPPSENEKVVFSLGVSFVASSAMEKQMKELITLLVNKFSRENFMIAFHHSLDKAVVQSGSADARHLSKHLKFERWVKENNYSYVDISGSDKLLKEVYSNCDIHVGYRVHAHIYTTSIGKPSILISEDGRGTSINDFLGGFRFNAFSSVYESLISRVMRKLRLLSFMYSNDFLPVQVLNALDSIPFSGKEKIQEPVRAVNLHSEVMRGYIKRLP